MPSLRRTAVTFALTTAECSLAGSDGAVFANAAADTGRFRVFLSYSSDDKALVKKIEGLLIRNGLEPYYDRTLPSGTDYISEIQKRIAHSHAFVPIITPNALASQWVNQEIGYAVALRVPILPVAIGKVTDKLGMLSKLQVTAAVRAELDPIALQITPARIAALITEMMTTTVVPCSVANQQTGRAEMLSRYADEVKAMERSGPLRQMAALSTFSVPAVNLGDPVWKQRYGELSGNDERHKANRSERISLGEHAARSGARLILNPVPALNSLAAKFGHSACVARLETLIEYLTDPGQDCCRVVVTAPDFVLPSPNLTILGDWFAAEAVSPDAAGFRQTILTRHTPTVLRHVGEFDGLYAELTSREGKEAAHHRSLHDLHSLLASHRHKAGSNA